MGRAIRGTALLAGIALAGACASWTPQSDRLLEEEHFEAATVAAQSIAMGLSEWIEEQGFEAICFGDRNPEAQYAEFEEELSRRIAFAAPVVVQTRECERTEDAGWRVAGTGMEAVNIRMTRVRWIASDRGLADARVEIDGLRRFTYDIRVAKLDGPWYTDDVFCNPGPNGLCVSIDPGASGS